MSYEDGPLLDALGHTIGLLKKERAEVERLRSERQSASDLLGEYDRRQQQLKNELRITKDARDDAIASEEEMRRVYDSYIKRRDGEKGR